jgi:hypothetical protein
MIDTAMHRVLFRKCMYIVVGDDEKPAYGFAWG